MNTNVPRKDGDEKVKKGLVYIKANGQWMPKSRYVYCLAHPEYEWKKGDVFIFLDNDRRNFSPENIMKCTMREHLSFNALSQDVHDTTAGLLAFRQAQLRVAMLEVAEKRGDIVKEGKRNRKRLHIKRGVLREIANEKKKQYCVAHREEIAAQRRQHYQVHRNELIEKGRQYYAAHKEEVIEKKKRYYQAHKEEIIAKKTRRCRAARKAKQEEASDGA